MKCNRLTPSVHVHCTVGVDIKVLSAQSSKSLQVLYTKARGRSQPSPKCFNVCVDLLLLLLLLLLCLWYSRTYLCL